MYTEPTLHTHTHTHTLTLHLLLMFLFSMSVYKNVSLCVVYITMAQIVAITTLLCSDVAHIPSANYEQTMSFFKVTVNRNR